MKRIKSLALLCAAAIAAFSITSCGKDPEPTPEPEPDPKPVITITAQPQNITVTEGAITGNLTVAASVTEGATLSYQWYSNASASSTGGTAVSGATSSTFPIPTTLTTGAHYYFCEVSATGDAVSIRSNAATVTVSAKPVPVITISGQPQSVTVTEGKITGSLTVEATVTLDATLTYQWFSNTTASNEGGTAIDGATAKSLTIPTDLKGGSHFYFVEVKAEGATSVKSNVVTVAVEGTGEKAQGTRRYVTVPYNPADFQQAQAFAGGAPFRAGAPRTRAASNEDNILVYSTRDPRYNYYIYYGGRIDLVPLLYQQAVYYNGVTPITVGYSKSESVETTVTRGLEKATTESVETSNTLGLTVGVAATVGFGGSGVTVSTEIETSVTEALGRSVSTSNTFETTEGLVAGETFSTEATIGTNNEPVGMYRYALFSSTDIFYNVKYDRTTKTIVAISISLCARPTTYWGIDYDPELGGSTAYGKTGEGPKLKIPEFDLNNMPDIPIVPSPGVEARVESLIWAGANVGETPHTFAADASKGGVDSYGGLYQFNSKKAWPALGPAIGFDASDTRHSSWSWENDPCPPGWRVPTRAEWENLLRWRDSEPAFSNGIWSWRLGNNSIYLPAVRYRAWPDNIAPYTPAQDNVWYWSSNAVIASSGVPTAYACNLVYNYEKGMFQPTYSTAQRVAQTVRCVRPAED